MALTPAQIASAVVRDCKRKRLADYEIRMRRAELVRQWLRSTPWFLQQYPQLEQQAALYNEIKPHLFRLTAPKKKPKEKRADPKPHEDPRNLRFFK